MLYLGMLRKYRFKYHVNVGQMSLQPKRGKITRSFMNPIVLGVFHASQDEVGLILIGLMITQKMFSLSSVLITVI